MSKIFGGIVGYFQESFAELKKVTWLTRNKAIRLTFIVLGFCLISAAVMGVLDLGFNRGYQALVNFALKVVPPAAVVTPPVTPAATDTTNSTTPTVNVDATGPVKIESVPVTPTPTATPTPATPTPTPSN